MEKHLVDFTSGKSQVWKYFGFWNVGNSVLKDKAVCKMCKLEYTYNGNTTTLRNHIMLKHPECSMAGKQASQPSITSILSKNKQDLGPLPCAKQEEYNEAICNFLIEDIRPISTVEGSGFLRMIEKFQPRYYYLLKLLYY